MLLRCFFLLLLLAVELPGSDNVRFFLQQSNDLADWTTVDVINAPDGSLPSSLFMRLAIHATHELNVIEKLEPGTRVRVIDNDYHDFCDYISLTHDTYIAIEPNGDLETGRYQVSKLESGQLSVSLKEKVEYAKPELTTTIQSDQTANLTFDDSTSGNIQLSDHSSLLTKNITFNVIAPSEDAPEQLLGANIPFLFYEESSNLLIPTQLNFDSSSPQTGTYSHTTTSLKGSVPTHTFTYIYKKLSASVGLLKGAFLDAAGNPYLSELTLVFHDATSGFFFGEEIYSDEKQKVWGYFGSTLPSDIYYAIDSNIGNSTPGSGGGIWIDPDIGVVSPENNR